MTDYKDLIAEARRAADKKRGDLALQSASLFTRLADALESLAPTTVTTVEELDALPEGSVVLSGARPVTRFRGSEWFRAGSSWPWRVEDITLPATVLFRPTPTSEEK